MYDCKHTNLKGKQEQSSRSFPLTNCLSRKHLLLQRPRKLLEANVPSENMIIRRHVIWIMSLVSIEESLFCVFSRWILRAALFSIGLWNLKFGI